ncbi:MAG: DUF1275 domain-containing protein [Flavobacterium sp.]|nr:DUF1275 domain-containing protein [Flavobacterium sp.]
METQKSIWFITLLLTIIAGYCDTVTFVAVDSIFSAHVTGNFIVFAYHIIKGSDMNSWIRLLTFPTFIIAIIIGGWIAGNSTYKYKLLLWEGIMLTIAGSAATVLQAYNIFPEARIYLIAMIVVVAMGLQNAFGKLYSKETYGPTTMMTGNVTQASLDLGNLLRTFFHDSEILSNFKKQLVTVFGFLVGCLLGALAGKYWGLGTLLVPGIMMLFCYLKTVKN